jgi:hypothetical protein
MPHLESLPLARDRSAATNRTRKIIRLLNDCKPISDTQRAELLAAVAAVPSQDEVAA